MNEFDDRPIALYSWSALNLLGQDKEAAPRRKSRTISSTTSINPIDREHDVDCTSAPVTLNLETAIAADGRWHFFTKVDSSSNALTIDGFGSETISGAATVSTDVQWLTIAVRSVGTGWIGLKLASAAAVGGAVSSVDASFTGGIVSVAGVPITSSGTIAFTVAGTSGGIPYFSSGTTWASSGALTASRIVLGGGAGAAPTVLSSLGTTTTVLHGNAAGAPSFSAIVAADLAAGITVYDVGAGYAGAPTASLQMFPGGYPMPRAVVFAAGLSPSQGIAGVAATAQTDFDILKNGVSFGTMRWAASGTVASFISAAGATFAAGDLLKVTAPASPDATLADISFVIAGTR